eukprot:138945-Amphidinium_carterae.1
MLRSEPLPSYLPICFGDVDRLPNKDTVLKGLCNVIALVNSSIKTATTIWPGFGVPGTRLC